MWNTFNSLSTKLNNNNKFKNQNKTFLIVQGLVTLFLKLCNFFIHTTNSSILPH